MEEVGGTDLVVKENRTPFLLFKEQGCSKGSHRWKGWMGPAYDSPCGLEYLCRSSVLAKAGPVGFGARAGDTIPLRGKGSLAGWRRGVQC